jgi:branched-chain amino acid transport system substrate-binding protein
LRFNRATALGLLVPALALGVAACGDDDQPSGGGSAEGTTSTGGTASGTLTVRSSLPLQGAQRPQTTDLVNGIKLALKQANNKAGNFNIKYVSKDDSSAQAGTWTAENVSANARAAAQDQSTVAYIGEFNSGASAISIPILSDAKLPQISPANTAVGLTSDEPGADPGTPQKYYPSGFRNYVRIVPKDTIQGAALATIMKEDGCQKVAMTNDKEVYGAGLAKNIELAADKQQLNVIFNQGIDPKAANYRSLAARAKSQGADCFVYAGITSNNGVQIYKDFSAALPTAKLYGPDGVAETGFFDPKEGGIPASVAKKVKLTVATLSPKSYGEAGKKFFADYEKEYGEKNPNPYSIYGYEAISLALDAIERSQTGKREDIVKALFATKDRDSPLGTYSIDENGDTTLTDYGVYRVENGEQVFLKSVKAAT